MASEGKQAVQTYVVFDTETTGLPSPGNNPKITELCLIAISREELLTKQRAPRVCNKLHLCLNPVKRIHHGSSELTGLFNDSLSYQAKFKDQASLIVTFLQNLNQPACILAHNGNGFDFPLLKAELNKCQMSLPDSIVCADTLEAFRVFDELPPIPSSIKAREWEKQSWRQNKDNNETKVVAEPVVNANDANLVVSQSSQQNGGIKTETSSELVHDSAIDSSICTKTVSQSSAEGKCVNSLQEMNEMTPDKSPSNGVHLTKEKSSQAQTIATDAKTGVKRNLFSSSPCGEKEVPRKSKRYSLGKLYQFHFGQEPEIAHTAEDDCKIMLKVIYINLDKVIAYCDDKSRKFSEIKPMY